VLCKIVLPASQDRQLCLVAFCPTTHLTSLVLKVVERQLFGGEAKGGKVRSV
jgi:hypothetical protein